MIGKWEIVKAVAAAMEGFAAVYGSYPRHMEEGEKIIVCMVTTRKERLTGGGTMLLRELQVDMAYRSSAAIDPEEAYAFEEACANRLWPTLDFAGRRIMPENAGGSLEDGVGKFSFTLTFADGFGAGEDGEIMEEIRLETEAGEDVRHCPAGV